MAISKHSGIIILIVCLVFLVPGYPMTTLQEMGSPLIMAVLPGVGPILVTSSQMGIAFIV